MSAAPQSSVSEFIRSLPKAELHLHLEGSVDPPTLAELSRRHPTPLRVENPRYVVGPDSGKELTEAEVEKLYRYKDFLGFLMAFKAVSERLRTPDDYELITYRLMQKLHAENVLHAEVYVSVGVIHFRGQEFAPMFEGLERGRTRGSRDFGVSLFWIFDATRHFGPEAAMRVVEEAILHRDRGVIGFGVGGDEKRAGPELFREAYAYARKHGLRLTCHAGESCGPQSIAVAVEDLHAERIGHGLNAWRDPALLDHLAQSRIPIEVCLSSNVHTGCCPAIEQHPLRTFLDHGLMVTLNTDDPEMFLTSLNREYQLAQQTFGLTDAELRVLAMNSFRASFLPAERKQEHLRTLGD